MSQNSNTPVDLDLMLPEEPPEDYVPTKVEKLVRPRQREPIPVNKVEEPPEMEVPPELDGFGLANRVMSKVSPATELAVNRINELIKRAEKLRDQLMESEEALSREFEARDSRGRDLIARHGSFISVVERSCSDMDKSLTAIADSFPQIEPLSIPQPE